MMPSNSRNDRSPLRAVTNTANSPLTRKAGSTPVKRTITNSHIQKPPLPRTSLPLPPSDSKERDSNKQKKPRASLNKRVSFGGNSINVYYKQSEFSPPENEPAGKAARTFSRFSPSPQRSPRFSRPDARLLPPEDEGTGDDTMTEMPEAPSMQEDPYFADQDPAPVNENPSPVPVRRDSIGFNDRQSFGVFVDEDITMGERDVIRDEAEDMTIELPRMSFASKARRVSNTSVASDGDITQPLYSLIPRMLHEEDNSGEKNSTDEVIQKSLQSSSVIASPEGVEMKLLDIAQDDVPEPEAGNEVCDVPSTEGDNQKLYTSNTDYAGMEANPAEHEAQQDSIGPISSSPAINEHEESSHFPSPAVPVRARPVPPNCRKLFDNDANEDEDTTLHYHEKSSRPAEDSGQSQRKALGILSVLPSTPRSATQSKLRTVIEERSSASGKRDAASKLRELSSSAMRSSRPETIAVATPAAVDKNYNLRDFLQAVQLNFDKKAETRQRGQSLAPLNYSTDNFDRASMEGKVLESIRKASILETFRHQIEILRANIVQDEHNIDALGRQIESIRPPLFSKMAGHDAMPIHETTTYRVSMKRLRKLSTLKAKEEWVASRHEWETTLGEKLKAAVAALEQDTILLNDSKEDHRAANSLFIGQVAGLGLGAAFTDERPESRSTDEDTEQQRAFIQEMSIYRDVRGYLESQMLDEEDLNAKRESLAPRKSSLLTACVDLRKNASASSDKSVKKMITERMELNSIVSGVSGVNLMRVNRNSISLRAVDMMDIQFSLHDEKIINTSCKTVSSPNAVSCPVWQPYIDGAVSLVNWNGGVKNAKFVRDIPSLLYRCTSALRQARLVYEDAAVFLDKNMGRIVSGGLRRDEGAPCLDLTVEASFYSLALRSKFDITVTVTTQTPSGNSAHLSQEATLQSVNRYFGDKPEDKLISEVLIQSGRRDLGMYSLADGLAAVWNCLR